MTTVMTASAVLEREFLEIRAKLLELAASFDRLDRGEGVVDDDPRMKLIEEAIRVLQNDQVDRAEQLQLIFSLDFEDDWREKFGI